ncbi:glycoside hydrolase domain-containing protein [Endozoicomonas atrinae]|uniref:glycoside hydrolase domain-containing protein n=1 Tax=Endozoicomonas atrinae TaxID=1333660 RepID=UPI003B00A901
MGKAIEYTLQKSLWPEAGFIGKATKQLIASAACALCLISPFSAANNDRLLLSEADSLPFIHTFEQASLENGSELIISGNNGSSNQQVLIVRIDNENSSDYRSRVNQEFTLSPGPFEVVLPLSGLKTSGGQPFKQPYSKLFIFSADTWADIDLEKILLSSAAKLPENTLALDFGSSSSAAFPGFESIGKNSSYLKGKITERVRTSGDSLIRDGIAGVTSLQIPWPDGLWKLSLWTQDQGEWEYLPHFLTRQIIANGTTIIDEKLTREQWINDIYLAGREKEGSIDGDLWDLVGKRRSDVISKNIRITDGMVNIDLTGDYDARYLAALVLEPLDGTYAQATQEKRRERLLNQWSVATEPYTPPDSLSLEDISQQVKDDDTFYLAARNSILNLAFEIESPIDDVAPAVVVSPPKSSNGKSLTVITRYGHWRYERPTPNATSLILDDSYLRSDMESIRLSSKRPRRLYVQVEVPSEAFSGEYSGMIQLFSRGELRLLDYKVRVLPTLLPELESPVGLYMEPPPYYQWFKALEGQTSNATSCDLSLLASHGFSTVAPAFTTPDTAAGRQAFIQQLQQLERFGFNDKILAYSPLKRLLRQKDETEAIEGLKQLQQLLENKNLPDIYWSIFDEPANDHFSQIKNTASLLNDNSLQFNTAGHMNHDNQAELAEVTDLLLINHGTEVTEENINDLKESSTVWLYNMPRPRLAAGLYLWRSGADGYLQWHGRMPTADPFDPTDGREGDVMYIYPSASRCPEALDIHRRFLDLHEATIDLRWLQWLEHRAEENPEAEEILEHIKDSVSVDWKNTSDITNKKLLDIREKISEIFF